MIVLDTSILSLAFRRSKRPLGDEPAEATVLRDLIARDAPLAIPDIALQEILSGMRTSEAFTNLTDALSGFPLLLARRADHIQAARLANDCRGAGVAASTIDCLIAAQALGRGRSLFTSDSDFVRMAPICGLKLFTF